MHPRFDQNGIRQHTHVVHLREGCRPLAMYKPPALLRRKNSKPVSQNEHRNKSSAENICSAFFSAQTIASISPSHTSFPIPPPQSDRYKPDVKRRQSKSTKKSKTYNSGYSLVVTHLTTNPPVRCLNRAERTGSLVFNVLWSYVNVIPDTTSYILHKPHNHNPPLLVPVYRLQSDLPPGDFWRKDTPCQL